MVAKDLWDSCAHFKLPTKRISIAQKIVMIHSFLTMTYFLGRRRQFWSHNIRRTAKKARRCRRKSYKSSLSWVKLTSHFSLVARAIVWTFEGTQRRNAHPQFWFKLKTNCNKLHKNHNLLICLYMKYFVSFYFLIYQIFLLNIYLLAIIIQIIINF